MIGVSALCESDLTMLIANHSPGLSVIALATHGTEPGDKAKKIISECAGRAKLLRQRSRQ
jgi:hypothetical protein